MATARTTGAKKTANTTKRPNQTKQVLTVKDNEVTETVKEEAPKKLSAPTKADYVKKYRVPDGHNGIINPTASSLALADATLVDNFTLDDLIELGADVDWLLKTGQIVEDGIKIVNQY